ncbi:hypothetical protein PEBR_35308 [Penicillium brasilianum]|uniref:Uncharacterized protein n=1 Tax=Penicillium brasilianum TaxID=104259 RepID=A0A1S9RD21_PENBI|nr:hypothetical protein PEBR_35308 [Penicillium brasilianum]
MLFLEWILDNFKVKKFSSLHEYWRQWCQLYRKAVGRSLHVKCSQDINDHMKENLTARYNLDITVTEKPVMNVDDLYIVLNHHWTKDTTPYPDGSRPGALVYVEQNERTNLKHFFGREDDNKEIEEEWDLREDDLKTLCYGQISLILLPNPGGIRDHLVMEIDLKHTKGHHSKPKRKIFLMSEVKQPTFDIIILVLAMVILDNAFAADIHSVEDIQGAIGMIRATKPYDLRRGTGEAVDMMGHVYASTFQKYMNERVQTYVQASFLGIPLEDALMNILSHQSRYIDPRAPSTYDDLLEKAKELYGSMKNTRGTKIGELKAKADAALRAAKKLLKTTTFNGARNEFFATIDTLEINKQLDPSFLDIKQDIYEPERIVHRLKERR